MKRAYGAKTFEEEKAAIIQMYSTLDEGYYRGPGALVLTPDASLEVRNDKEVALACVRFNGELIESFSEPVRADKEVALAAVSKRAGAFEFVGEELRADKQVVLVAMRNNVFPVVSHMSVELREDIEVMHAMLRADGTNIRYLSEERRADKNVVLEAVRNTGLALEHASEELRGDKEVVLEAVRDNGLALGHACKALQGEKEVVLEAVITEPGAISYASKELQADHDVAMAGMELIAQHQIIRAASDDGECRLLGPVLEDLRVFSETFRVDLYSEFFNEKDTVLLVTRKLPELSPDRCYHEAVESALAVPGQKEPAPSLVVTLTRKEAETETGCPRFHAEAALLSGEDLACEVPVESRGEAVVNDLAKKFLSEDVLRTYIIRLQEE